MVGIKPNFTPLDVLRAFFIIDKNVSRQVLVKKMEIGEGTVRSILNILKQKQMITSTQKGHTLTDKGEGLLNEITHHITVPKEVKTNFYKNKKQAALVVMTQKPVKVSTDLRDIGVRRGASSAMVLNYSSGKLLAKGLEECDFRGLEKLFDYKQNNTLVIAFADKLSEAMNSALAIALEIDSKLNAEIAMTIEF